MADEKPKRTRWEPAKDAPSSGGEQRSGGRRVTGAQIARRARQELAEITGLQAEAVTSLEKAEDSSWIVTIELLELSRIPETDDVLGSYEAVLDESGELVEYRRVRRYARSQAGLEQGVPGK